MFFHELRKQALALGYTFISIEVCVNLTNGKRISFQLSNKEIKEAPKDLDTALVDGTIHALKSMK